MNQAFIEYFRCPETFANFAPNTGDIDSQDPGYFTFGRAVTVFGRSSLPSCATPTEPLPDAMEQVCLEGRRCALPFNPTEVATNLRNELYTRRVRPGPWRRFQRTIYYALRPLLTTAVRRHLQKASLKGWERKPFPQWPVDRSLDLMFNQLMSLVVSTTTQKSVPFIWFWPRGYTGCAIMTHDVETSVGLAFTPQLKAMNASFGIPASFQLIPGARYTVTPQVLSDLKVEGCEVNVHDLKHDGHLFDDREGFEEASQRINAYVDQFEAKGFRAGVLYRNQDWFKSLRVSYDMSVPNVAHLDPQAGGCCTVMPYFIGHVLELPVTATQDYSLFNILETYSHDLWKEQIRLVLQQHGLLNFIVHPDYLDKPEALECYMGLLAELARLRAEAGLWTALPREVDLWWRQRSSMNLVPEGQGWAIKGEGSDRACIAYATLRDNELVYSFA